MTGDNTANIQKGTSVILTEEEAKLFMTFRQYQTIWQGVFGQVNKNKKIELHFDEYGTLKFAESSIRYYNGI